MTRYALILVGLGLLVTSHDPPPPQEALAPVGEWVRHSARSTIPWELSRLQLAYPGFIRTVDERFIHWRDGSVTEWSSARDRLLRHLRTPPTYEELLKRQPVRDFSRGLVERMYEDDEGRQTFLEILKKVYGATPQQVERNLRVVRFMPRTLNLTLRFNERNGAADALEAVGRELDALPPIYHRYLQRSTTYINRSIRGTRIPSLHSWGIAIDINPRFGNYWRWDVAATRRTNQRPRNRIPLEIVNIFEKHGFLWGGRWYFYDTLHFEYRPELFLSEPQPE